MKRFTSILLSIIMLIGLSLPSFAATNSITIEEATDFLGGRFIDVEDIVSIESLDDTILFNVSYLSSGEISQISYNKDPNNNITVVIDEGDIVNVIEFMANGTTYIDGIQTSMFDSNAVMPANQFAVYLTETCPAATGGSFPQYFGVVNDYTLTFETYIRNLTKAAIQAAFAAAFGFPFEVDAFETLADTLKERAQETTQVRYSGTVYVNTSQATLQYFYKYNTTYTAVQSGISIPHVFYRVEQLL